MDCQIVPVPAAKTALNNIHVHVYITLYVQYIVQREQYSDYGRVFLLSTSHTWLKKILMYRTCTIQMVIVQHVHVCVYIRCTRIICTVLCMGNSVMGTGILQVAAGLSALIKATNPVVW